VKSLAVMLLAGGAACAVTLATSLLLMRGARRIGLYDPPGARKPQRRAVPLVGGALLAGLLVGGLLATRIGGIALRAADILALAVPLLCFAIGVVDDARLDGLTARSKAVATAIAFLPAMHTSAGGVEGVVAPTTLLLATLAFLALHAINTIDHAHGLCGMVALVGSVAIAIAAVRAGETAPALLSMLVAGSACGFLCLNFPRGLVFLGDGGSLLLGGCFAMALIGTRRSEWLLLAAVPLADLLSVAALRLRSGTPPWVGDRRHVTHRLMARGMSEPAAVALLAFVQTGCSVLAAPRLFAPPRDGAEALVAGVIVALAAAMLLVPEAEPTGSSVPPRRGG
jgi:UDP-GlcNAc:undecaprenyl-phosphate GlcNAc-1-phosphate transferase